MRGARGPAAPRPLLPRWWRAAAVLLAVLAAVLLGVLSADVAGTRRAVRADDVIGRHTFATLARHRTVVRAAVDVAGPVPMTLVVVALGALLLVRRRPEQAVLAVATPAVATVLTEVLLKPLVHRTLGGGLSFPSGHATGVYALALVLAVLLIGRDPVPLRWPVRAAAALVAVALAVVIGLCQYVAGNHYPTDTIAAGLVALVAVVAVGLGVDVAAARWA